MGMKVQIKMTKAIQKAVDKAIPQTLKEGARYVWRIARSVIKHRSNPDTKSAAGKPPHSHASKKRGNDGFKKTIVWALDPGGRTAVIGPQLVRKGLTEIAKAHEFGGSRMIVGMDPKLKDGISVGEEGPVTVNHVSALKDHVIRIDPHIDPLTGRYVVWIKIRTKKQAEHSTRLYFRMIKKYGKKKRAKYPARPYMRPALELGSPKLGKFWKNVVKP